MGACGMPWLGLESVLSRLRARHSTAKLSTCGFGYWGISAIMSLWLFRLLLLLLLLLFVLIVAVVVNFLALVITVIVVVVGHSSLSTDSMFSVLLLLILFLLFVDLLLSLLLVALHSNTNQYDDWHCDCYILLFYCCCRLVLLLYFCCCNVVSFVVGWTITCIPQWFPEGTRSSNTDFLSPLELTPTPKRR